MKATGIVRKVDELGRIVLPVEMRRTLDIAEKDALEIYVEGTSVILKKYKPSCIFCDATKNVTMFKNKCVCPKCLRELRREVTRLAMLADDSMDGGALAKAAEHLEEPELLEAYRTLYQGHFPGAVFRRFVQIPWSRPE